MRKIGRSELSSLLNNNVCEIVFVRRSPERAPNRPIIRRMLCTNSIALLDSENGKRSLNFRYPRGPKKINESIHNVVVVWDIFMQDYRNVSVDVCYIVKQFPADDSFWQYYNDVLYPMSKEQKLQFMDNS